MSVGDSADEFISIHALGREVACVVTWSSVTSSQILFFARWETIESFRLSFLYTSRQMCFNASMIGARHKSPAVE